MDVFLNGQSQTNVDVRETQTQSQLLGPDAIRRDQTCFLSGGIPVKIGTENNKGVPARTPVLKRNVEPMPDTAPATGSVSRQPPRVNDPALAEFSQARVRCETRMRVVYDKSLSPGARLLYVALDDYAGMKGIAWPRQTTLAKRLGWSEGWVRQQLRELEASGYILSERRQRGVLYRMGWQIPTVTPVSVGNFPTVTRVSVETVTPVSVGSAASIYEPVVKKEPGSCRCGGTGWLWYEGTRMEPGSYRTEPYRKKVRCECRE